MGLAILYQRETGCPWSLTHRPTRDFAECFPPKSLPSPDNASDFVEAVQDQVLEGVVRFSTQKPDLTAVAERVCRPLEGLLGWHDFFSEDGSYNPDAHDLFEDKSDLGTPTEILYGPSKNTPQPDDLPVPLPLPPRAKEIVAPLSPSKPQDPLTSPSKPQAPLTSPSKPKASLRSSTKPKAPLTSPSKPKASLKSSSKPKAPLTSSKPKAPIEGKQKCKCFPLVSLKVC